MAELLLYLTEALAALNAWIDANQKTLTLSFLTACAIFATSFSSHWRDMLLREEIRFLKDTNDILRKQNAKFSKAITELEDKAGKPRSGSTAKQASGAKRAGAGEGRHLTLVAEEAASYEVSRPDPSTAAGNHDERLAVLESMLLDQDDHPQPDLHAIMET